MGMEPDASRRPPTGGGVIHRRIAVYEEEPLPEEELDGLLDSVDFFEAESAVLALLDAESDEPALDPSPLLAAAGLSPDSFPPLVDPLAEAARLSVR